MDTHWWMQKPLAKERPVDMKNHKTPRLAMGFALVYPTLLTWVYFIALARESSAVQQTAYTLGKLLQFGFPLVWAWFFRREMIGLPRPKLAGLIEGVAFGIAVSGGIWLAYHYWLAPMPFFEAATEPILDKLTALDLLTPSAFILLGVSYSLLHSLLEEYYWRWFVFARLAEATRLPTAIVVSSLGFMAHHVLIVGMYFGWFSAATWLFSLAIAIGGAAWAWLYHRSRSLIGPWLSHLLVDAAIFAVGYDLVFGNA
jgi:membrane protease YdiL (CAAX protease family)